LPELARHKKKRRYNLLESIFFILVALLALYILIRSPLFEVQDIVIEGNHFLASEKIISVAGVNKGENIFKINLHEVSERLKIIPMLKSAELSRKLPSFVIIKITERTPLALLPSSAGFAQVDSEGVYLQKGLPSDRNLPVITGLKCVIPPPGKPVKGEGLGVALGVVDQLPAVLLPELSEINIGTQGDVCLYTLDGVQCRLGTASDIPKKGLVLSRVLSELKAKGKKIAYIDLSYVGSPVVKYSDQ